MTVKPVYLSGPIQGRAWEDCAAWRERATALLGPTQPVRNPMDRGFDGVDFTALVEADIADIRSCWALLVKFDVPTVGTTMEIRLAFAELNLPVYVWYVGTGPKSPWLLYHTTRFFDTLEEACAVLLDEAVT